MPVMVYICHIRCKDELIKGLSVTVCGADESPAGRVGLFSCRWLPLCSDRRKAALLFSGGPSMFRHQDPRQLPLQGNTTDLNQQWSFNQLTQAVED